MTRVKVVILNVLAAVTVVTVPTVAGAQSRYTAKTTGDIVQLRDSTADVTVSVMTSLSNAYEIVVKGQNIIQTRFTTVDQFRARPGLNGIPLLAPFANRLDETAFYANGKKYNFDMEMGNVRGPVPIHGFVGGAAFWELVEAKADANSAWVTSRLDFHRYPQFMAQFPFAHTITMTYRLSGGIVEVRTRLDNLATEPMPIAIGFHPSFWLTDSTRDEWTVSVAAKTHWPLASNNIPTGVTEPITNFFPDPKKVALKDYSLDHVFGDLERDAQGRAVMTVKGKQQQLDVMLGPKYKAVVIWSLRPNAARGGGAGGGRAGAPGGGFTGRGQPAGDARGGGAAPLPAAAPAGPPPASIPLSAKPETVPPDRGYIALEPMAGITNSMNMAQKGTYKELQSVPAKGSWEESFWIRASGF
jgi:aldose 1-epimerase